MRFIDAATVDRHMSWKKAVEIMRNGHLGKRPVLDDLLLQSGQGELLGRAVHLPEVGIGMKVASMYPPNRNSVPPKPTEDALYILIREEDWRVDAVLSGPAVTRWKTAADSALASSILSRPDSHSLLCIGAGPIAEALVEAHLSERPSIQEIMLWNRTPEKAEALRIRLEEKDIGAQVISDLNEAVGNAHIITSATPSPEPVVKGAFVRPGTHVDLVGGFSLAHREGDDELVRKASIYVDNLASTVGHVGDIQSPIASGVMSQDDIRADLFALVAEPDWRRDDDEITMYKNGGGAHLDLLIARQVVLEID
ncbi:MAG: ornithine cyclodeaminase [Hyphomicrobiaceae bacterium]|nr:ornithine cyclodeaminase [Hyphomicrobiaceae bacterium]